MKTTEALFELKTTLLKNSFLRLCQKSRLELVTLLLFLPLVSGGLYWFFSWSLDFFASQEPFGLILIDETLFLFTFALMLMLFISSSVSAYASLFRSREVFFLIPMPITWSRIFFIKLADILWMSSWAMLLAAIPFITAYGQLKSTSFTVSLFCLLCFLPFIVIAGTFGTLTTTLIMYFLPNRKRRKIALGILAALGITLLANIQPEIIKEQGSLAGILTGYLPHVALAKNAFLPSAWMAEIIMAANQPDNTTSLFLSDTFFYFSLLLSNAMFILIPAAWIGQKIYPAIFFRLQDHGEQEIRREAKSSEWLEKQADKLRWPPRPVMALLEKDIKTFLRDPSEWSQMLIFFGLLILYFANLRNLEFHILKEMWKNLIFLLNTIGTYIVLSSFSMRFIFPMLSLEGNRFWMIGLSPIRFSQILLEKFTIGVFFSGILTLPLIVLSGWMLEMPVERIVLTTGLGFFVCLALTGLSVGFGALFPNFKSTNPAEIISGSGGSFLLAAHLLYLAGTGAFLAFSNEPHPVIFSIAVFVSLLTAFLPLHFGVRHLQRLEF